ncbi:winged helix-turn-helix domain-containing protein [Yersinia enterocolitica]|nr:winged helix-turn-helix domain-containing protein [Yersinia enterocolitica]HEI6739996.1 winged helix-turn-helix domain-containing protein [Yersinia enterocolitica]
MIYEFIFDKERRKIIKGSVIVNLSCKEASLLSELIKSQTAMKGLSYIDLAHTVWPGRHECINTNNITQLVFKLRSKLKLLTPHPCIINIKGNGYQLSSDIRFKIKKTHLLFIRETTAWLMQLFFMFIFW